MKYFSGKGNVDEVKRKQKQPDLLLSGRFTWPKWLQKPGPSSPSHWVTGGLGWCTARLVFTFSFLSSTVGITTPGSVCTVIKHWKQMTSVYLHNTARPCLQWKNETYTVHARWYFTPDPWAGFKEVLFWEFTHDSLSPLCKK